MRFDPTTAGALLERTPTVLRTMLQGLPGVWLNSPETADAWSPRDVARHMADLERDGWLSRVHAILDHGAARPLPGIERERFRMYYADTPIETVLDDFESARRANLAALEALDLDEAALAAAGRHHVLGPVRLSQLLSTWVVHDLAHLGQIARAMAAQYRTEVGPWAEFLSILRPREESGGPAGTLRGSEQPAAEDVE